MFPSTSDSSTETASLEKPGQISKTIGYYAAFTALGMVGASLGPTLPGLAERRLTITGRVSGWFFAGASAGGMTLPWLIGQPFEPIGPQVMMFAILVDLIVAVSIFAVLILRSGRPVMNGG